MNGALIINLVLKTIFGIGFNIVLFSFIYSLDSHVATVLVSLWALKGIANMLYQNELMKKEKELLQTMLTDLKKD